MMTKVDIRDIVLDHVETIYSEENKTGRKKELFFFFGFPFLIACIAWLSPLSEGLTGLTATIMSIFSGLLLNVQVLVCDVKIKLTKDKHLSVLVDRQQHDREKLLQLAKELYTNISFCLVVAIFSLLVLFMWYIFQKFSNINICLYVISIIISMLVYYLISLFFLSLLMVAKRSYSLIVVSVMEDDEENS